MTVRKFQGFLHYREIIEELKDLWRPKSFRIHRYSSVVDPGEGLRGPLFLDQTEARRVEKNFFETAAPLSQGLDDRPPPPSLIWRSGSASVHAICIFYSPLWKVYGHLATKPFRHQEVNSPLTHYSVIIDVFTHLEVTWRNFLFVSCLSDNQEDIYLLDFLVFEFNFFHSFFSLFFVRCVTCGFFLDNKARFYSICCFYFWLFKTVVLLPRIG